MRKVRIEELTSDVIVDMFGKEPPEGLIIGWAAYYKGRLAAIAGIKDGEEDAPILFTDGDASVVANDIAAYRVAKMLGEKIMGLGYAKLYAYNYEEYSNADKFIKSFGFVPTDRAGIYEYVKRLR